MGRWGGTDRVWLSGAVACLLFMLGGNFLLFKANRLVAGEGLSLVSTPWVIPAILLWTGLLAGSLRGRIAMRGTAVACGSLLFFLLIFLAGHLSSTLLSGQPDAARVSLGSGFWGSLLGLSMVLLHARKANAVPGAGKPVSLGLMFGTALLIWSGTLDSLSLLQEYAARQGRFLDELTSHLAVTFAAVGASTVIGFPLGLLLVRSKRLSGPVFSVLNTLQTIPSLALFGLLIAPLAALSSRSGLLRDLGVGGIGWAPAVVALTLYALLPMTRSTYVGFRSLDEDTLHCGRGMGMNRRQLFLWVELPLAMPLLLNGLRISSVQTVGNTAVAALIGAGGLGVFIFQGLGQGASDLILLGALPIVFMAVLLDLAFQALVTATMPKGGA
jgi:osmoprotectant transport system permease protein